MYLYFLVVNKRLNKKLSLRVSLNLLKNPESHSGKIAVLTPLLKTVFYHHSHRFTFLQSISNE